MSRRRDSHRHPVLFLALTALLFSGCVFDPATKDGGGNPPPAVPTNQDQLIQKLSHAYQFKNYEEFVNLFPLTDDHAPYQFVLNEPVNGVANWDLTEELRIHRRMFKPEDPLPGETPVAAELWLNSITITLARTADAWVERPDLYRSEANPDGLDPAKWKATEAEWHPDVLFDTASENDYRVDGRANFVVIEDLTKASGTDRKFLIYRWEDLGNFNKPVATPHPITS